MLQGAARLIGEDAAAAQGPAALAPLRVMTVDAALAFAQGAAARSGVGPSRTDRFKPDLAKADVKKKDKAAV